MTRHNDHNDDIEPETILQPSLHSLYELAEILIDEAESRGIDCADLRRNLNDDDPDLNDIEIGNEALDRVRDYGYYVHDNFDTILIYPKGYEPPDQE